MRPKDCATNTRRRPASARPPTPIAGLRLPDAIDHVVAEVERRDVAEVVLVGQSWGG